VPHLERHEKITTSALTASHCQQYVARADYSLQQYDCSPWAQPNQLWNVLDTPNGTSTGPFRVVSANSAKCIDVPNASTANGVYLQQYDCNLAWSQSNQAYTIYVAPTPG
jgi:Ricin-type beta-trefoil lectin domain-like